MRDSRAHVEASGGRPQGRLQAAVRHRRRGRVRDQPAAPAAPAAPLPRGRARGPRAAFPPATHQPRADARRGARPDRRPAHGAHRPRARRRAGHDRLAPRSARACRSRRPRPSGASSTRRASSCPSRASARAAPGIRFEAAAPNELLAVRLHPLAPRRRDARSRSLAGSTTTPATCSAARPSGGSRGDDVVATFTRGRRGARLARRHAHRQRRGLHVALHRRPQRLRVPARLPRHPPEERGARAIPRPRARSSASTRPSSAGSGSSRRRGPSPSCRPSSMPSALAYDEQRPHRAIGRRTPAEAYRATPKAHPAGRGAPGHFRLRYDIADNEGRDHPAPGRPPAPPRDRCRPCPSAGPRHRRRARGHGRRPRHRRDPLDPPHRARARATGATTTRPRPMAGVSSDQVTWTPRCRRCPDSCVTHVATHDMVGARGLGPTEPTSSDRPRPIAVAAVCCVFAVCPGLMTTNERGPDWGIGAQFYRRGPAAIESRRDRAERMAPWAPRLNRHRPPRGGPRCLP